MLALGLPALLASLLVAAAETGRTYLQASAYGDERRFGLRPPLGYLTATVLTWLVWVTAVITAPLAWAARAWWLALATTLLAVAATLTLPRRWHQLSRRWLVFVPAGLVVHDPVVLADSLLLQRSRVRRIAANELGPGAVVGRRPDRPDAWAGHRDHAGRARDRRARPAPLGSPRPTRAGFHDPRVADAARRSVERSGAATYRPLSETARLEPRHSATEDGAVVDVVEDDALAWRDPTLRLVPRDLDDAIGD